MKIYKSIFKSCKLVNFIIFKLLWLIFIQQLCASEEIRITHPNFIQFELSRLNQNFELLLPRKLEERNEILNLAANEITMASGIAAMKDSSTQLQYAFKNSRTLEDKYYLVEKFKIQDKNYCIIITVNSLSNGYELYEKLLYLFNILEELKISFDSKEIEFDDKFKKSVYKGCFKAESNMAKFYETLEGEAWLKKIKMNEKSGVISKRVELGYDKWVEIHGASHDVLASELWRQLFRSE